MVATFLWANTSLEMTEEIADVQYGLTLGSGEYLLLELKFYTVLNLYAPSVLLLELVYDGCRLVRVEPNTTRTCSCHRQA